MGFNREDRKTEKRKAEIHASYFRSAKAQDYLAYGGRQEKFEMNLTLADIATQNSTALIQISRLMKQADELDFGPVVIEDWFQEVRIGYYDDDSEDDDDNDCAVVYLGNMFLDIGYFLIPPSCLRPVTTVDLWKRREAIHQFIGARLHNVPKNRRPSFQKRYQLLLELAYIDGVLMDRLYEARFHSTGKKRPKLFISHSSKDKQFAKWLAIDLANSGYQPWLDEWSISAGESIPTEIGVGIEQCDFVLLVLSKNSTTSNWVGRKWQAKYWKEVEANQVMIIPILMEDCDVPTLLRPKKYADFRTDYGDGFEILLSSLQSARKKRRLTSRSTRTARKRAAD
jgi:hypothetical protein